MRLGVVDLLGHVWCLRCWGGKDEVSDVEVLVGDRRSLLPCKGCERVLGTTDPKAETISVQVILDGGNSWPELKAREAKGELVWVAAPSGLAFARLPGGMQSGRSSVAVRLDLPGGKVLVFETSMRTFLGTADAFRAAENAGPPGPQLKG